MIRNLTAALALLSLAACGGPADDGAGTAPDPESTLPAAEETDVAATETPAPSDAPVVVTIPETVQGRWGLVPADCTSTKGDAKGLLTITPTRLQFYESVGTLTDVIELAPNRIRGRFDFTGEGMKWQREQVLSASDDGKTLVRREMGEDAAPKPFQYLRCS